MFFQPAIQVVLAALILMAGLVSRTEAQPKQIAAGHSCVDVVSLKAGRSLRGSIAWREPNGSLTMLVSLGWMREFSPTTVDAALTNNLDQRRSGWTQTRDRIAVQLKSVADAPRLAFFLQQELERIDQLLADRNPVEPEFLWIDVPHQSIVKIANPNPDQFRLALFGWSERLAHVETRDGNSLKKELAGKGVRLDGPLPDLSERLSARSQSDREWAARMALIEYTLKKPLDFQGIGDSIAPTREGQAVDFGEILPKLLQQQVSSFLKDLTSDNGLAAKPFDSFEWLKPAIREAESAKQRGFRVTKVVLDTASSLVKVESQFVAQIGPGQWQTVWRSTSAEDGTKERPAVEAVIEQDPQFKSLQDAIKPLGLFDSNALQRAIRVGAATMAAQQNADELFSEYRERYTRRLDSPPLAVTTGQ